MNTITQLIAHIHRQDFQYRAAKFEPLGLKACHGKYLKVICDNPGICQEELTAHIVVNKSNIARQVAALEEAGVPARLCLLNSGDSFVAHGAVSRLKAELYLDSEGIMKKGLEVLERG